MPRTMSIMPIPYENWLHKIRRYKQLKKTTKSVLLFAIIIYFTRLFIRVHFPRRHLSKIQEFPLTPAQGRIYRRIFNQMGVLGVNYEQFYLAMMSSENAYEGGKDLSPLAMDMLSRIQTVDEDIKSRKSGQKTASKVNVLKTVTTIHLATVACEALDLEMSAVMLKSALIFSQDSNLHLVIFTRLFMLFPIFEQLINLKWQANTVRLDFTFEILMETYPKQFLQWKNQNEQCAFQRIFFPEILKDLNSILYLEPDTIVLSNLTEIWENLPGKMLPGGAVMALTSSSEHPSPGQYSTWSKIPYYGLQGLNAAVALMNLTEMRRLNFQRRSLSYYEIYRDRIEMAVQDIYNIFFHFHPEKLLLLDCSYNFRSSHCPRNGPYCQWTLQPGPICYCYPLLYKDGGVRVLHGDDQTFFKDESEVPHPFIREIFRKFSEYNFATDSSLELIQNLREHFRTLTKPCFYLNDHQLYNRAEKYLGKISKMSM